MNKMKKIISIVLLSLLLIAFCSCSGNYGQIDLKDTILLSDNGFVEKAVFEQIREENAIATFRGIDGDFKYEWLIFGTDIGAAKDAYLAVNIQQEGTGISVSFSEEGGIGFPALLSIYLNEKWNSDSAGLFHNEKPIGTASITGSKNSILNVSVTELPQTLKIIPEKSSDFEDKTVQTEEIATSDEQTLDTAVEEDKYEGSTYESFEESTTYDLPTAIPETDDDYLEPEEDVEEFTEKIIEEITENNEPETITGKITEETTTYEPYLIVPQKDDYLSGVKENDNKIYTGGSSYPSSVNVTEKDGYISGVKDNNDKIYTGGTSHRPPVSVTVKDDYTSGVKGSDDRVYSSGTDTLKDKYDTDPVPAGKPMPVEPEDQKIDKGETYTCTFSIECSTILNNIKDLDPEKRELVPSNGVILAPTKVTFYKGESVFDVLKRVCKEEGIHMEFSWTPIYNSAYIEGINNLYEFDCGALSGWMYRVDGWYPNYGCSRYQLAHGEVVEWRYTCDLGEDVGRDGSW